MSFAGSGPNAAPTAVAAMRLLPAAAAGAERGQVADDGEAVDADQDRHTDRHRDREVALRVSVSPALSS